MIFFLCTLQLHCWAIDCLIVFICGSFRQLTDSLVDTQPKKFLSGGKKVSLKDLCAEDKKRVANLIKELAK